MKVLVQAQVQAQGLGLGCLVFNFYSRRRAKRGGGYNYLRRFTPDPYLSAHDEVCRKYISRAKSRFFKV